jgi:hypothetical protein
MDPLDHLYARMLQLGFVVLRQAIESGHEDWIQAEIELLHNVPSLLGETNSERHRYFWEHERDRYLLWLSQHGSEDANSRMKTCYEPLWDEMEPLIAQRLHPLHQTSEAR